MSHSANGNPTSRNGKTSTSEGSLLRPIIPEYRIMRALFPEASVNLRAPSKTLFPPKTPKPRQWKVIDERKFFGAFNKLLWEYYYEWLDTRKAALRKRQLDLRQNNRNFTRESVEAKSRRTEVQSAPIDSIQESRVEEDKNRSTRVIGEEGKPSQARKHRAEEQEEDFSRPGSQGTKNKTRSENNKMPSSCQDIRAALAACLQNSDCIMIERNTPADCLRPPLLETLPTKCQQLKKGYGECKRGMVDMRKRFRGNRPIAVSQELEGGGGAHSGQLYAGKPAFESTVKETAGREPEPRDWREVENEKYRKE